MPRNSAMQTMLPLRKAARPVSLFLIYNADDHQGKIPNLKSKNQERSASQNVPAHYAKPNPRGTILLIEDQEGFRMVFRDILEDAGYKVLEAEDGLLGLDSAKACKPDVILLDLMLPKLHGLGVLEGIRADQGTKNIPVVILSVLDDKSSQEKAKSLGANGYIVKGNSPLGKILEHLDTFFQP